jgi:hypothetical protein
MANGEGTNQGPKGIFSWLMQGENEGKLSAKRVLGTAILVIATILAFREADYRVTIAFASIGAGMIGLTAIPKA